MNAGNFRFKLTWSSLWHLLRGATRFVWSEGITIPRLVLITDVSKWQGKIDFLMMILAGAKGVIIKCGQGAMQDLHYLANWAMAKLMHIPRGSYWFYDSRVDPKQQAANWWNWIKADPGELKHFLDLEESYGGSWKGWRNWKIFLQEFMRLSGLPASKIGIYTGYYYWIANSPVNLADLNWFGQFDLWLAWYTNDPEKVLIPKPWTPEKFKLWQFGTPAEGLEFGAESLEIDQSYFDGDEQAYKEYFKLDGAVTVPTGGTMAEFEGTAKLTSTPNVRIRKPAWDGSVDITGTTIGGIQPGQEFKGDEIQNDESGRPWMHITQVGGKEIDGWSAAWLLDYHEVVVTPPIPDPVEELPVKVTIETNRGRILVADQFTEQA